MRTDVDAHDSTRGLCVDSGRGGKIAFRTGDPNQRQQCAEKNKQTNKRKPKKQCAEDVTQYSRPEVWKEESLDALP